jgi:hypothetical protein
VQTEYRQGREGAPGRCATEIEIRHEFNGMDKRRDRLRRCCVFPQHRAENNAPEADMKLLAALPTRDRFLLNWPRHTFCLMRAVPRLADAVCPGAEIEGHGFQRRTGPRQIGAAPCQSRCDSETGHARTEEK